MRAVVQRVSSAAVSVAEVSGDREVARIAVGLLLLVGVERGDGPTDVQYIANKITTLRVFDDPIPNGRHMQLSVKDVGGGLLVVSQFTLLGDCERGRRPSFDAAASPEVAEPLYQALLDELRSGSVPVSSGEFRALMRVSLVNDGPVTILLDSRKRR